MPKYLRLSTDGEPIEFFSLLDIARKSGRSKSSLIKLTARGVLPPPNFKLPDRQYANITIKGEALYSSEFLVPHIIKFLEKIKQGKKVSDEDRVNIMQKFSEERSFLLSLKN